MISSCNYFQIVNISLHKIIVRIAGWRENSKKMQGRFSAPAIKE